MTKPNPYQVCPTCQKAFLKPHKRARYCSPLCQIKNRIAYTPNGCWLWNGATNNHGYGQIRINSRLMYVHRVMFEICRAKAITPGKHLLHSCDNPRCCNPSHLREGDYAENQQDALKRGRRKVGLTPQQAAEVKALKGIVLQKDLAKRYGVSGMTLAKYQKMA